MLPSEYKERTGKSVEELADEWGISLSATYKYLRGERIPEPEIMKRIHEASGGLVTANSIYGLPSSTT